MTTGAMAMRKAARAGGVLAAVLGAALGMAEGITKTTIRDTLYNADGTPATGEITVSWKAFTAVDGSTIAGNSLVVSIVNGVLKVALAPNQNSTPANSYYTAAYLLAGRGNYTETWVVPVSVGALTVGQVRVAAPPAPPGGGSGGAPATLQNIYTLGGATGVGPASFGPGATIEIFDATPATGLTRQILRSGAGQGSSPVLEFHYGTSPSAVGFRVPPLSSSTTYTLPAQDGLPGTMLQTDGAGNLIWASPQMAGGSGVFYQTFQNAGTPLAQRNNANFTGGLQAADDAANDRTNVSPAYGTAANTVAQGNDARFPTASQAAALAGTSGSPGGANAYVTNSDPRNTNARAPLAHAATHAAGGSDPVTPGSIGALKNTSDVMNTGAAGNIGLVVKGAPAQTASLQEWHDSNDNLLASVTSTGRVFFPEAFFSAPTGQTATSLFFQVGGLDRFSMTAFATAYSFNRYDDSGNFKDTPLQIVRGGGIQLNDSVTVKNPAAATGATKLAVEAGAGQGATNLQEWQNSSGTALSSVGPNGFFNFPAGQAHGNGAQVQAFTGTAAANDCAKFDANGNVVSAGGSCGSVNVPVFQDGVIPAGTVNGVNTSFTLSPVPSPASSLVLTRNGVVQDAGVDYTLAGGTVTFTSAATPQAGDILLAWYRSGTTPPPANGAGGDLSGTYPNPSVAQVGGVAAANVASGANAANAAASANTAGAIVKRDASGNFSAGTITASLSGNAGTATALAAAPAQCGANQFATGIAASGSANCAQPAAGNLSNGTTGSGAVALAASPSLTDPSLAGGYVSETKTAGSGGTTANLLVKFDGSGNVITMAPGDTGAVGVAVSTRSAGSAVEVATRGVAQCVADNATAVNDLVGAGTGTAGACRDLGQTSSRQVSVSAVIIGRALQAVSAGSLFNVELYGPGLHGFQVQTGDLPAGIPNSDLADSTIALSMPSDFAVSGSPASLGGTLSVTANTQSANTFKAGPASGSAAAPSYRTLAVADLPVLTGTSGQGYFFGASVIGGGATSSVTTALASANQMPVFQFVLPYAATVNNITFEVTTASGTCSGTCHANIGIWDAGCANLLAQTGVMTSGGTPNLNAAGVYTVAAENGAGAAASVTLAPGTYWLAFTTDSTALVLRGVAMDSKFQGMLNNQTTKLNAQAGNNGSAGAFPSNCGALTTAYNHNPPLALFAR